MNRIFGVFLVAVSSCSIALATSTNIVGTGSGTVVLTNAQFTGSGKYPTNYAANVETVAGVQVSESTFTGGAGATITTGSSATSGNGGAGLKLKTVDLSTIVGGEFQGGSGGSVKSTATGALTLSAVGGAGIKVNEINLENIFPSSQQVYVQNVTAGGGGGGSISGLSANTIDASGGAALSLANAWLHLENSDLLGGAGGSVESAGSTAAANGGDGLLTGYDAVLVDLADGVSALGGAGGSVAESAPSTVSQSVSARGGRGVNYQGLNFFDPTIVFKVGGGTYAGGAGGTVANQSGTTSIKGANVSGGDGFFMTVQNSIISNGVFTGGDGGRITGLNTGSIADGGAGMYVNFNDGLEVLGGTFEGGTAGFVNGVATGSRGAGLRVEDTITTTIRGGTFNGLGLWMQSASRDSTMDIRGGSFEDARFSSFTGVKNTITISGGLLGSVLFDGAGTHNVSLTGGNLDNMAFTGTGTSTLNLLSTNATIGLIKQTAGTVNASTAFSKLSSNVFVSNGTMNVSGSTIGIGSGDTYRMGAGTARLNFTVGATVQNGGFLDVGLGTVTATNFVSKSGSQLSTELSNSVKGLIKGTRLTFESGTQWSIVGSADNALAGILLAQATSSLTNRLNPDDLDYNTAQWWTGISSLYSSTNLGTISMYAAIGNVDWNVGLDAAPGSEYEQAMQDLSTTAISNTAAFAVLTSVDKASAQSLTENGFVRTTEIANTLIGLQGLFADQIKDRTQSNLRGQNWGSSAFSTPRGARGPESLYEDSKDWYRNGTDWLDGNLPSWDASASLRNLDESLPRVDLATDHEKGKTSGYKSFVGWLNGLLPELPSDRVELPPAYQIWGRGYGSFIDRQPTSGQVGYDASVAGGVVGLDKRFDHLLLGLGGGYAQSFINGKAGNDGNVQTLYGTAYAAVNSGTAFLDANVNYAVNSVETEGNPLLGYTSEYDANTVSMYIGGGLGYAAFHDALLFTPEASLLTTYYDQEDYTETSPIAGFGPKHWDAYDQWSYLGSLGATLSMIQRIDNFKFGLQLQPELRAHWLHEFNADADGPVYSMVPGSDIAVALQAREEDLLKLGAGIRFSKWSSETLEFGLDVDAVLGGDYSAYIFSGKLLHRF